MKLFRRFLPLAVGVAVAATAAPLRAAPIVLDQWYTFGFGAAGTLGTNCPSCTLGIRSVLPGDPAWTITTRTPFTFLLTDGFLQGDSFSLLDNAALVGSTPGVAQVANHSCGNDEVACYLDPAMSHAGFAQGAGAHSYDIRVDVSPYGSGAAFFCLASDRGTCGGVPPVPEPATYVLLATGLVGVAGIARRRRA